MGELGGGEDPMSFLGFIFIGLIAGWLAGHLVKGGGFGFVGNIAVGVLGALIGGFLARNLGFSVAPGFWGNLLSATLGAVVLLVLLRLLKK
jgi:uncharacterized membrane protein YeaQ/YmgE (transglycosylase-associated protein family)